MNQQLHPAFQGLVSAFASAAIDAHKAKVEAYVSLLKRHDWHFEYSDDQRCWLRGRDERRDLNLAQKAIDPTCAIWNEYAPASFHRAAA